MDFGALVVVLGELEKSLKFGKAVASIASDNTVEVCLSGIRPHEVVTKRCSYALTDDVIKVKRDFAEFLR